MKCFLKILMAVLILPLMETTRAQQVVSAGGGFGQTDLISLSFTLGEPVSGTLSAPNLVLTQGFQQPFNFYLTQTINVPAGWSGISGFIEPADKNVEALFMPYGNNFVILSSMTQFYYPDGGVNSIIDWSAETGYNIKAINDFDLTLTGKKIKNPTVSLTEGWNLIPVLTSCGATIEESIGSSGSLIMVKEVAGSGVYWPEYGISTLTELSPGKAYFVAMSNDGSFTYPACAKRSAPTASQNIQNSFNLWGENRLTASSHVIAFPAEVLRKAALKDGDVIGVFTTDNVFAGFATINNINSGIAIAAFADDATTPAKEGFSAEEALRFRLYNPVENTESWLYAEYEPSLPNAGFFADQGLSVVKNITGQLTTTRELSFDKSWVYPNPSGGKFDMTMNQWPEQLRIHLTDNLGKTIQVFELTDRVAMSSYNFDLTALENGVYFLKLISANCTETKKIIINK